MMKRLHVRDDAGVFTCFNHGERELGIFAAKKNLTLRLPLNRKLCAVAVGSIEAFVHSCQELFDFFQIRNPDQTQGPTCRVLFVSEDLALTHFSF